METGTQMYHIRVLFSSVCRATLSEEYENTPRTRTVLQLVAKCGMQLDELDVEDQRRVGRNGSTSPTRSWGLNVHQAKDIIPLGWSRLTVCLARGDGKNTLLVETHVKESFLPPRNNLTSTDCMLGR